MPRNLATALALSLGAALASGAPASAGEADVLSASAEHTIGDEWTFKFTVRHDDDGWSHYADAVDFVAPDGTILGTRKLFHPHVQQPFTRLATNVVIPRSVTTVTVRAHDSVDGYGGTTVDVDVSR